MTKKKLVIYTVLTGAKEPLGNPKARLPEGSSSDLELSWVCFTDNRKLTSDVWEMRYIDRVPLPTEKLSRRPKALPHEYLQDWEYSLYIDNITVFTRLPQSSDLATAGDYVFKAYKHATRVNPLMEADAIIQLGYESSDRLCEQIDFYARYRSLEDITPLSTCTVILRQHMHPTVMAFGTTWWEQILNFGKRDQMSFDFALQWHGAKLEHFPGLKHDNDLIENTANLQPNRVHANFDAVRYAWEHRDDPAAKADPRQHYLDHGRHSGRKYAVDDEILEYLCHRLGSSLGSRVAPRRSVAESLQGVLRGHREKEQRLLLIRIQDDSPTAYARDEMAQIEHVLCTYLARSTGTRLELTHAHLAEGNMALRTTAGSFEVAFIIGVPGHLLAQAHTLVRAVLAPAGLLVMLTPTPASLAEVARIEAAIAADLGRDCQASVQASRHDALDREIPNSVLSFSWGA